MNINSLNVISFLTIKKYSCSTRFGSNRYNDDDKDDDKREIPRKDWTSNNNWESTQFNHRNNDGYINNYNSNIRLTPQSNNSNIRLTPQSNIYGDYKNNYLSEIIKEDDSMGYCLLKQLLLFKEFSKHGSKISKFLDFLQPYFSSMKNNKITESQLYDLTNKDYFREIIKTNNNEDITIDYPNNKQYIEKFLTAMFYFYKNKRIADSLEKTAKKFKLNDNDKVIILEDEKVDDYLTSEQLDILRRKYNCQDITIQKSNFNQPMVIKFSAQKTKTTKYKIWGFSLLILLIALHYMFPNTKEQKQAPQDIPTKVSSNQTDKSTDATAKKQPVIDAPMKPIIETPMDQKPAITTSIDNNEMKRKKTQKRIRLTKKKQTDKLNN